MCLNNNNNKSPVMYIICALSAFYLLLFKRNLVFYKTDRSASNFETFLDNSINWFFTFVKDVF